MLPLGLPRGFSFCCFYSKSRILLPPSCAQGSGPSCGSGVLVSITLQESEGTQSSTLLHSLAAGLCLHGPLSRVWYGVQGTAGFMALYFSSARGHSLKEGLHCAPRCPTTEKETGPKTYQERFTESFEEVDNEVALPMCMRSSYQAWGAAWEKAQSECKSG